MIVFFKLIRAAPGSFQSPLALLTRNLVSGSVENAEDSEAAAEGLGWILDQRVFGAADDRQLADAQAHAAKKNSDLIECVCRRLAGQVTLQYFLGPNNASAESFF